MGDNLFGVDVILIREIIRQINITPVEMAPSYVSGLMNLRGQIVTVLDLGIKLQVGERNITNDSRCIILKTFSEIIDENKNEEGIEKHKSLKENVGLLVDKVEDVVIVLENQIEPPPANIAEVDAQYIEGIAKLKNDLLIILNVEKVLQFDESMV